ncbi:hypothetical protein J7T55_008012 [Diaporthe amygdali]|uniref:uncharacterized protein n=1 Tax=Phomopsis amygdali TaxID=1214568 RepID=UPI0022FEB5F2|nr:uncharacterized protein J7T55_008012 [Diaporthe amygdali]KAJ0114177.1 hypothetical protein J7T55_008012 [Diaporthe amygdali]
MSHSKMPNADSFELPDTFTHNGWSIRYLARQSNDHSRSASANPWVVFVHGTPWSSDVFRPLANALLASGSFNVVLYDLPGYGQSQTLSNFQHESEPDTSVKAQAESLAALLHHLDLDGKEEKTRPHIVAHDIAGLPAGVFEGALRAIIQSARANSHGLDRQWEDVLARPWLAAGLAADSSRGYDPQKNFVRQIKQSSDSHTAELLDNGLYSKVRCDVKILWGEKDAWIPYEKMQSLEQLLGNRLKGLVTIPEAGHLIMLDQPERVTLEIVRWLGIQA